MWHAIFRIIFVINGKLEKFYQGAFPLFLKYTCLTLLGVTKGLQALFGFSSELFLFVTPSSIIINQPGMFYFTL